MRRIGLTQRVEVVPDYGERRDALDQNWAKLLGEAGLLPQPLSNAVAHVAAYVDSLDLAGVILTGGNDLARFERARNPAPERDRFEWALVEACRARQLPILGVCRGMQVLNLYFGGALERATGHVRTRHRLLWDDDALEVNSYHDYVVPSSGVGDDLRITARCEDGTVEAFRHDDRRIEGVMWHPERERPFHDRDVALLRRLFGEET